MPVIDASASANSAPLVILVPHDWISSAWSLFLLCGTLAEEVEALCGCHGSSPGGERAPALTNQCPLRENPGSWGARPRRPGRLGADPIKESARQSADAGLSTSPLVKCSGGAVLDNHAFPQVRQAASTSLATGYSQSRPFAFSWPPQNPTDSRASRCASRPGSDGGCPVGRRAPGGCRFPGWTRASARPDPTIPLWLLVRRLKRGTPEEALGL